MTAHYIRSLAEARLEDMKEEEKCSFVTDAESASGSLRENESGRTLTGRADGGLTPRSAAHSAGTKTSRRKKKSDSEKIHQGHEP